MWSWLVENPTTQEGVLEETLGKVRVSWPTAEFVLNNFKDNKDVYMVAGVDDLQVCCVMCIFHTHAFIFAFISMHTCTVLHANMDENWHYFSSGCGFLFFG